MRVLEGKKAELLLRGREQRGMAELDAVEPQVRRIVNDVRKNGERALRRYAERWDGVGKREPMAVRGRRNAARLGRSFARISRRRCNGPQVTSGASANGRNQKNGSAKLRPAFASGQIVRPLSSVGCYVPGGRYPLPSTMLMTVIPAQVAGVRAHSGGLAASGAGDAGSGRVPRSAEFYRIGGAQAIAALATGTDSVPRVDKIVGPGNKYVTAAKRLVATVAPSTCWPGRRKS